MFHVCIQDAGDGGFGVVAVDENDGVDVEWTVGGAFQVDSTQVTRRGGDGVRVMAVSGLVMVVADSRKTGDSDCDVMVVAMVMMVMVVIPARR